MKTKIPTGITEDMLSFLYDSEVDSDLAAAAFACEGYCAYCRVKGREDDCGGLAAVLRGVATGKIGLYHVSSLLNVPPAPVRRTGCLINEMCHKCRFLENDCDFMSPFPPPESSPCGGYRLLQALVAHGVLTPGQARALIEYTGRGAQGAE